MTRAQDLLAKWKSALFLCLVIAGGALPGHAQDCMGCAIPEALLASSTNSWTFRKRVNEVQVFFTASRHGKFVTGLTRDEVSVQDNDKPAEIVDFRDQNNLPLRVVLLVDTSDSVNARLRFEQRAANSFLGEVLSGEEDRAAIGGFAEHLRLTQDFTHEAKMLGSGLGRLASGGGTALYDAVVGACRMLSESPDHEVEARILVVLSDGDDNSSKAKLAEAIAIAQQSEVTVYAISTNYAASDLTGDKNLKQLAMQTGGEALFPGTVASVKRAFAKVREELRHRYAVAYRPPEFDADGHFRSIHIWAKKSGKKLRVKARKGYYAR